MSWCKLNICGCTHCVSRSNGRNAMVLVRSAKPSCTRWNSRAIFTSYWIYMFGIRSQQLLMMFAITMAWLLWMFIYFEHANCSFTLCSVSLWCAHRIASHRIQHSFIRLTIKFQQTSLKTIITTDLKCIQLFYGRVSQILLLSYRHICRC